MENSITPFFKTLQQARKFLDMTQLKLAKALGMQQSHVSRIEAGKVNMQLDNFIELARTLEFDVVLVPRQDLLSVKALIAHRKTGEEEIPAYTLDDEGDDD